VNRDCGLARASTCGSSEVFKTGKIMSVVKGDNDIIVQLQMNVD